MAYAAGRNKQPANGLLERRAPFGVLIAKTPNLLIAVTVSLLALTLPACSGKAHPPSVRYHGGAGKIPISTASEKAYHAYVTGRDLQEKLRHTDARVYYEEALELDPDFAMAHLAMASTKEGGAFLESLERALQRVDDVSPGERAMILAMETGSRGDREGRLGHYETLVQLYPEDERAHLLLGSYYFGNQQWDAAIEHYERAVEIAPDFSQPYNQLGYAYRFRGEWVRAEKSFTRYIELIPEEPNPYDSYAEMLMKMGRFDESIAAYRKALSFDPEFVPSYVGIGNNEIFKGDTDAARETLDRLHTVSRTDGERRTAHLWTAVSHLHDGNRKAALETLERRYRVAERTADLPSMVDDLILMADVHLENGDSHAALGALVRAEELAARVDVPGDLLKNFNDRSDYLKAKAAIVGNNPQRARQLIGKLEERLRERSEPRYRPQMSEINARIALAEGDYSGAIEHLEKADDRDPRVLFLRAVACEKAGDLDGSRAAVEQVANFNAIHINLVHVRQRAQALLAEQG